MAVNTIYRVVNIFPDNIFISKTSFNNLIPEAQSPKNNFYFPDSAERKPDGRRVCVVNPPPDGPTSHSCSRIYGPAPVQ